MRLIRALALIGLSTVAASGCTLYGFGGNDRGQLGDGTGTARSEPVAAARNPDWIKVDAGFYHSCGIDVHNALYCWGNNVRGELGLGFASSLATSVPTRVGTANDWTDISAGGASSSQGFTCGIRAGALFCWGFNQDGQLGIGSTTSQSAPTQVGTDTNWKQVSVGVFHACGLRTTGALSCWGVNHGTVGDGTNVNRSTPVAVGAATDWTLVSAGFGHTCGIRTGGALYCWGGNLFGEVGDGTSVPRLVPTRAGVASGWTSVGAGDDHTCAIRSGALYCWGSNQEGELGNGTTTPAQAPHFHPVPNPNPVQVGTSNDWTAVAGGANATCGIRARNLLFCWGNVPKDAGQQVDVPTQVSFDKWWSVSLGSSHVVGLRNVG